MQDDIYSDADIEMIEISQEANELSALQRLSKGGKAIDADARDGLKWLKDNHFGGSLTFGMTQWLQEEGYDVSTDEAQDEIYKAIFR